MSRSENMASSLVLEFLCSSQKIERDRGVVELNKLLNTADDAEVKRLEASVQSLLEDATLTWESKHGALMGTKTLLSHEKCSDEFVLLSKDYALRLLEHNESRVRLSAGEVMGTLCKRTGPDIYVSTKDVILEGVRSNLERKPIGEASVSEQEQAEKLAEKLAGTSPKGSMANVEQIFHDTAGWKSLETWMKCLEAVIKGCGTAFNVHIDQELLDLIFHSLNHTNRFVRETGYYVCGALVSCNTGSSDVDESQFMVTDDNAIFHFGSQFAAQLAQGLADNWSQVRLAASVAARNFLLGLPVDVREKFYSELLPPLCLNRYYVADGVRIYNLDTWRLVTEGHGGSLVEIYIKEIVEFYISQSEADNHAVREAACSCIAELGSKVSQDKVRPFVPTLLDALHVCFKDQSWPVRDAACVACGNFIRCFPDESKGMLEVLFPLFYENLQDYIPSVRQGAALALSNVCMAYGDEVTNSVLEKAKEAFEKVESQPDTGEKYGALDKGPATYGVVKRLRDNDMELHTDKQMYSCGSLAPKMHRGSRDGGCMDHQFRRPPEPWEMADGCIYLLGDLAQNEKCRDRVSQLLPVLAKAAQHKHYTQHVHFLESTCKQLPHIAKGIGKRHFKMYIELFFDSIFYGLTCDNTLTVSASSHCLNQLSTFVGPGILRGRVEQYNPRYLNQLDANQVHAPL